VWGGGGGRGGVGGGGGGRGGGGVAGWLGGWVAGWVRVGVVALNVVDVCRWREGCCSGARRGSRCTVNRVVVAVNGRCCSQSNAVPEKGGEGIIPIYSTIADVGH
jgi:hypothetical protein